MLKETPRSLRAYFAIVAAYSAFVGVAQVARFRGSILHLLVGAVTLVLAFLFAYIVAKFAVLLSRQPSFIKRVLTVSFSVSIVGFLASLFGGLQPSALFGVIFSALIYFYLTSSVTRLAGEATAPNT